VYIRINTGGEYWAFIKTEDKERALQAAASCYAYAREKWPNEKTRIEGVDKEELKLIRKMAKPDNVTSVEDNPKKSERKEPDAQGTDTR